MLDVLTVLAAVVALRAYLLVPRLSSRLLVWSFPGTAEQARAALADADRLRDVPIVAKAAAGAMAQEMPRAGLWVLSTLPRWSWSAFWPLWLPGSVRGAVLGALVASQYREDRLDG